MTTKANAVTRGPWAEGDACDVFTSGRWTAATLRALTDTRATFDVKDGGPPFVVVSVTEPLDLDAFDRVRRAK